MIDKIVTKKDFDNIAGLKGRSQRLRLASLIWGYLTDHAHDYGIVLQNSESGVGLTQAALEGLVANQLQITAIARRLNSWAATKYLIEVVVSLRSTPECPTCYTPMTPTPSGYECRICGSNSSILP
jgi:hypothetical protein